MIDPYELMRQNGVSLRESAIRNRTEGRMSATPIGGRMVRDGGALMLHAIKAWRKDTKTRPGPKSSRGDRLRQLMDDVGDERAGVLTLQVLVDKATTGTESSRTVAALRRTLGAALEVEASWGRYKKASPVGYAYGIKDYTRARGVSKAYKHRAMVEALAALEEGLDWDSADKLLIAARLIDMAVKSTGLFAMSTTHVGGKSRDLVALSPAVLEWVAQGEDMLGLLPRYMPITEEPLDWEPGAVGGFDPDRVTAAAVLAAVSTDAEVLDLSIEEPDVEDVVRRVYQARR